jgi:hypothetical protein
MFVICTGHLFLLEQGQSNNKCKGVSLSPRHGAVSGYVWRKGLQIGRVPVTTAWRALGLHVEDRPPDMEGSWEYIE